MNLDEYSKEKLWQLLVEAVHASVMYPTHKAYTRDTILPSKSDISAVELAERLGMPLGEAWLFSKSWRKQKKLKLLNLNSAYGLAVCSTTNQQPNTDADTKKPSLANCPS